jgi:benzylsuccinate CoA-transferase BbsF subunit
MTGRLPLAGVRIADFCWVGAGSYTTKIFADLGADVIKIESRERLDSLRLARPFAGGQRGVDRSGYFADRNTSKRSVTINLKTAEGRNVAERLILASDVVTNNFTPGTLDRLGLGYERMRDLKPGLVYAEMSMQGADGPASRQLGYGSSIAALCGLLHLTAEPGRLPAGTGTNYPDHIPNPTHAAFAILAALRHRRRTGEGQYIDIAQTEPLLAMMGPLFLQQVAGGAPPVPQGNRSERAVPHGVFPCRGDDRWIAVSVHTEVQWNALCSVLEASVLADDPRFAAAGGRRANVDALEVALAAHTASFDAADLADRLQAAGVPAGPVLDARDVLADPQLVHRGHWVRLEHPEMGETVYNAPPFRFARAPVGLRSRAPLLGEHTEEVCRDLLGLPEAEVASLREDGTLT